MASNHLDICTIKSSGAQLCIKFLTFSVFVVEHNPTSDTNVAILETNGFIFSSPEILYTVCLINSLPRFSKSSFLFVTQLFLSNNIERI